VADENLEREPTEEPGAKELTPEEMKEVTGGINGPPIKPTSIPGNPI